MRRIRVLLYLVAIAMCYTSALQAETIKIPLYEIAPVKTMDLKCTRAEYGIKLPIPERWQIKTAILNFGYVNSSTLLAQNSRLVIKLNGYPLAQITLNPVAPEGEAKVSLPPSLLKPGYSDLTFFVSQHYTLDCEHPCAPELWTTLKLDEAFIEMEYELKPVPLRLSSVSDYLFDPRVLPHGRVNFITEDQTSEFVSLASAVASGIALRFDYRNVVFSTSREIKPNLDNILIGRKEFVERFLDIGNLNIKGPFLQIMHLPSKKPQSEAEVNEETPIINTGNALIVISGENLEQVKLAARTIAILSFPFPNTDKMEVREISLPPVYPYTGKLILSPGKEYTFKTLDFTSHTFQGSNSGTKDLVFRLPTDLLIEPNRFADLSLHLTYGAGMRPDSALNIILNGKYITAIHLDNPNGAVFSDYKVPIPAYLFRRGNNVITFQAVLTPSVSGHCELIQTDNLFLSIFDDSSFHFPNMSHWVDLPRMELFFEDGFPFTRWPDGRETAFYITQSDSKTISSALNLMGLMSQKIGYPLLNMHIGLEKPEDWKGEIIVLGKIGTIPEDLSKQAPLKFSPILAPYPISKNLNGEKIISKWRQLKNVLLDGFSNQAHSTTLADTVYTALSEQIADPGPNDGIIMEFQSPYEVGRSVLLVTAVSEDDLEKLSHALLNSSVQGKSEGDLALIDLNPPDYTVSALKVGEEYYSGKLGKTGKMKSYITTRSWLFFFLLGLSVITLSLTTFCLLEKYRQRRLGHGGGRINLISLFLLVLFSYSDSFALEKSLWEQFKNQFISQDGRIIDYYQDRASHSEGQGYGMLLAILYDDKPTFDKVWDWTKSNLGVRKDNLLAWRWGKRQNGEWEVIDYNNATDGDILVAFALLKARKKWNEDSYRAEGLKIIKSMREKLVFGWQDRVLLLPSYYGFTRKDGAVINPSYFIFPAYRLFAEVDEKDFWEKVYKDAYFLLSQSVFSSLRLPADWIVLGKSGSSIFSERSQNFGYEAIRIPLYSSLEERPQFLDGIREILNTYKKTGYLPLWVDLVNDSLSLKSAPAGFYAIYGRVAQKVGEESLSKELFDKAKEKLAKEKEDYYSFALYLLANGKINK